MQRHTSRGFVLSLLLCVITLLVVPAARGSEPPIPVDPAQSQPVELAYRFSVGAGDRHALQLALRATRSNLVLSIEEEALVNASMTVRQAVQSIDETGRAALFQEVQDLLLSQTSNGEAVPGPTGQGLSLGVVRRLKLDPQGRVHDEEVTLTEPISPTLPQLPRFEDLIDWIRVELPERQVTVGQSWSQRYGYSFRQEGDLPLDFSIEASHTYLGQAVVAGTWCAVIQSRYEMPIEIPADRALGTGREILGRGTGDGFAYIDLAGGRMVQWQMEFGLVMQTNVPENPLDYTVTASLALRPLAAAVPPQP